MTADRVTASFRDPSGFLFRHEGRIYRQVNPVFRTHYDRMMTSGFYREATDAGLLIPHEEVPIESVPAEGAAYKVLRPEQVAFISYPYEWSFGQLRDAALLTLTLQRRALEFGLSLKDASAYNVQFHRGRPVFIDSLSFETYPDGRPWIAYQQFCKHFLAPLALMAHCHVDLNKLARIYVDGVPLEVASRMLSWRTYGRFTLLTHIHAHARALRTHADRPESAKAATHLGRTALLGLIDNLEGAVRRLTWTPTGTEWADYYDDTNYSSTAHEHKKTLVASILEDTRPSSVWDLGANTGTFSRLASERGIDTVAFDVDPAAVERAYRDARARDDAHLLPLVMDLTNPSTDLGWDGTERMSLRARGPVDVALALALVHHLAIGNNVPLDRVAACLRGLCRRLIIEFVPKSDSQVQRLLATREDVFPDYTMDGFERAFLAYFTVRQKTPITESERVLYVLDGA